MPLELDQTATLCVNRDTACDGSVCYRPHIYIDVNLEYHVPLWTGSVGYPTIEEATAAGNGAAEALGIDIEIDDTIR